MKHSEAIGQLAAAKARAQRKFLPIGKDKSANIGGKYSYHYADLATCLESIMAALSEEEIAVFQPTRTEGDLVVVTTMLAHSSGQWISEELAIPVIDPADARPIGSGATYARRYGVLAMVAHATQDEDDDGEAARGGDHEMAKTRPTASSPRVCPVCGKDALVKGRPEYGGGWLCFSKKGGCGTKWPEGMQPTVPPPIDIDPDSTPTQRRVSRASASQQYGVPVPVQELDERGVMIADLMAWPVKPHWDLQKKAEVRRRHLGEATDLMKVDLSALASLHAEVKAEALKAGLLQQELVNDETPPF